jgi:hypothetical protein
MVGHSPNNGRCWAEKRPRCLNSQPLGGFQPFAFYQLGGGTYLRSAPIWAYNFGNSTYSLPLGVGIGQ